MNIIRADLTDLDKLDVLKQGTLLGAPPGRKKLSALQKAHVKSVLAVAKKTNANWEFMEEPIHVSEHAPSVTIKKPKIMPVGMTPASAGVITVGAGLAASLMAVVGITTGAGLYGATSFEFGAYYTAGGGWWTNIGISAGPVFTVIFGPPSDLNGVFIGIGADVGIPAFKAISVGGLLLFSPPPIRFLGISIALQFGAAAIPVFDVTIQVTYTYARPLLK